MSSYIHGSAQKLGEKIAAIKREATEITVIQIDEADQILRPIESQSGVSSRDAEEVRAMLLREFQEPSNVFFILTTNLDPSDPKQADSALVRNERIGHLVAFSLPDEAGRQIILGNEIERRKSAQLQFEGLDLAAVARETGTMSPADLQAILSKAVRSGYDRQTKTSKVTQQHLLDALKTIKGRKQNEITASSEVPAKRPIGFDIRNARR